MAAVNDITTVANATGSGHGYTLREYTRQAFGGATERVAIFRKSVTGESGTTGNLALEAVGVDLSSATTARTNALAALNAQRRHRYAGAPGRANGSTSTTWPDGAATVPTVDTN